MWAVIPHARDLFLVWALWKFGMEGVLDPYTLVGGPHYKNFMRVYAHDCISNHIYSFCHCVSAWNYTVDDHHKQTKILEEIFWHAFWVHPFFAIGVRNCNMIVRIWINQLSKWENTVSHFNMAQDLQVSKILLWNYNHLHFLLFLQTSWIFFELFNEESNLLWYLTWTFYTFFL